MTLETQRLLLLPASADLAEAAADFYRRNADFLRPFEPERQADFFTPEGQRVLLEREALERAEDRAYRYYLARREDPARVVGAISLGSLVRGGFQSCFLGYKLDGDCLGRGYMTEAVGGMVRFAFAALELHRVEANIMPRNEASLRVVARCGFQNEGLSPKYLKINGVWEDHVHMVLRNRALE